MKIDTTLRRKDDTYFKEIEVGEVFKLKGIDGKMAIYMKISETGSYKKAVNLHSGKVAGAIVDHTPVYRLECELKIYGIRE